MKRVLITGATGYIGSRLAGALTSKTSPESTRTSLSWLWRRWKCRPRRVLRQDLDSKVLRQYFEKDRPDSELLIYLPKEHSSKKNVQAIEEILREYSGQIAPAVREEEGGDEGQLFYGSRLKEEGGIFPPRLLRDIADGRRCR